jgi:phosphatidate cytidylyltransferase
VSNTATRVLVAVVAIPGILALAWFGGYAWLAFTGVVMTLAMMEFSALCRARDVAPHGALMILGGWALQAVFLHERLGADVAALFGGRVPLPFQWQALLWVLVLWQFVLLLAALGRRAGSALRDTAASVLGFLYLGLGAGALLGLREIFTLAEFPVGRVFGTAAPSAAQLAQMDRWGALTVIAILASIWLCDTAAYFGGRAMGRHKLFERVSPKKTWEGAVWGFLGAVAAMLALRALCLPYLAPVHAAVMGVIVGVFGQTGDLVESLFKRDAGIKDSSTLLPGHGGIFDRFDSLLFVAPLLFLYLDFVVFA